jgi:tetratricopeptide (TPR) repeat protein
MMSANNDEFKTLVTEALAHHQAGRLDEAEAMYRRALAISPRHAGTNHNLGVVTAAQGRHQSAIAYFDEVIAAEPNYAAAHYNRAVALQELGRSREAIRGFAQACALEPDRYDAHRALGFLRLAEGERGRALDHFARTYELRRGEDRTGIAAKSLTYATRSKLLHDSEQFHYLAARRRGDGQRFETAARIYAEVAQEFSDEASLLSDRQLDRFGDEYNTAINIRSASEVAGRAVSDRPDREAITRRFNEDGSGVVTFDNLLTPPALSGLQRYLLESTIWHDFGYIDRFVASYLEDGLACPLLLQIVDELRGAFPELLGNLPLTQAWAFKGLAARATVDAHADDAAITVNFWVTPDAANRNPEGSGLAVCRALPPAVREVGDYDGDRERAVVFLAQHAADILNVPYRENRAVMFRSRLLHRSDAPEFGIMYENHRINVTLLFGDHNGPPHR